MLIVEHLHSNSAINPLVLFFFFNFILKSLQSHKKLQRQCKAVLCTLHLVSSYIIIGQYPTQLDIGIMCVYIFMPETTSAIKIRIGPSPQRPPGFSPSGHTPLSPPASSVPSIHETVPPVCFGYVENVMEMESYSERALFSCKRIPLRLFQPVGRTNSPFLVIVDLCSVAMVNSMC